MKTSEEALISTSVRPQTFSSQRLCVKLNRKQKHYYCSSQLLPALQYRDATPLFELAAPRSVRAHMLFYRRRARMQRIAANRPTSHQAPEGGK